jgi:hypothetical protein
MTFAGHEDQLQSIAAIDVSTTLRREHTKASPHQIRYTRLGTLLAQRYWLLFVLVIVKTGPDVFFWFVSLLGEFPMGACVPPS